MPIYEFQCTNAACNNIEEHLLRHSDSLPSNCEKCSSPIAKLVSQTSFALKGSGWYVTDYKGNNPGAANTPTNTAEATKADAPAAAASAASEATSCGAPACAPSGCASN